MDEELLQEFVTECKAALERLSLQLENDTGALLQPGEKAKAYRAIHTVKGNCGFFGLARMERLAKAGDAYLGRVRDDEAQLTEHSTGSILTACQILIQRLDAISATGSEPAEELHGEAEVLAELDELLSTTSTRASPPVPMTPARSQARDAADAFLEELADGEYEELLRDFAGEATEAIDEMEKQLLALEAGATDAAMSDLFRHMHTVKGNAAFLKLESIEELSHVAETLMSHLRDRQLPVTDARISALLITVDTLRALVLAIDSPEGRRQRGHLEIIARLAELIEPDTESTSPKQQKPTSPRVQPKSCSAEPAAQQFPSDPMGAAPYHSQIPLSLSRNSSLSSTSDDYTGLLSDERSSTESEEVAAFDPARRRSAKMWDRKIRVDIDLLDHLMNQVGELVLLRNRLTQLAGTGDFENTPLATLEQQLDYITGALQHGVMKTRMQPVGRLWQRFPRLVRELSRSCDKDIRLDLVGDQTELDRSILESIKDPLTHLLRNAIDHGIESPGIRRSQGKPATGALRLEARHEGGHVIIEISDDGAGIDAIRLRTQAIRRGLISVEQSDSMTDDDALQLIYAAGFSTNLAVTKLSGRGVGMDVVRTNVERIGGTIELSTTLGKGSSFRLRLPLTLAILPAIIIHCLGRRYVIPQVSVIEIVSLPAETLADTISFIGGSPMVRLRDEILTLVDLARVLSPSSESWTAPPDRSLSLIILRAHERNFALVVERIEDVQEVVVKPLGRMLRGLPCYASTTILDDGQVSLILDVAGIAKSSGVLSQPLPDDGSDNVSIIEVNEQFLIFALNSSWRGAIPVERLIRLLEIPASQMQRHNGRLIFQHEDRLIPAVDLEAFLSYMERAPDNAEEEHADRWFPPEQDDSKGFRVVVVHSAGSYLGLIVEQVIDIIDEPLVLSNRVEPGGIRGTAMLLGAVTDLFDVDELCRWARLTLYEEPGPGALVKES